MAVFKIKLCRKRSVVVKRLDCGVYSAAFLNAQEPSILQDSSDCTKTQLKRAQSRLLCESAMIISN